MLFINPEFIKNIFLKNNLKNQKNLKTACIVNNFEFKYLPNI